MGLPCWALSAEPEDLFAASQSGVVGKVPLRCIAFMVPLCQEGLHLRVLGVCKGWVLDSLLSLCMVSAFWAASFFLADPGINCCAPLVGASITAPPNNLIALCNYIIRGALVCFIVPLSRHPGSLGGQGIVLAHFTAAALRTTIACCSCFDRCLPAVHIAIWALIT